HFASTAPAPTHPSPLSLHDALPISPAAAVLRARAEQEQERGQRLGQGFLEQQGLRVGVHAVERQQRGGGEGGPRVENPARAEERSEEHTSELQSQSNLVCRLLLEKK